MRRIPFLALVMLAVVAALNEPVLAAGSGEAGGSTGGGGGQVHVQVPGSGSGGFADGGYKGGGGSNSTIECLYFEVGNDWDSTRPNIGSVIKDLGGLEPGTPIWVLCRDTATGETTYSNIVAWDPANPPVITPSAEVLAQMAANGMALPVPGVRTWPTAGGTGLVNLPVWLHVDNWETVSASASAGGLTATVEAVPVRSDWDMDDGSTSCTDAGSQYDSATKPDPGSSSCSFTYGRSSGVNRDGLFHNSATVIWHLRWYATNGQGGDLGELVSPTETFDLRIEESQALVAPGGR